VNGKSRAAIKPKGAKHERAFSLFPCPLVSEAVSLYWLRLVEIREYIYDF
jgi:hypothetical protein